MTCPATKHGAPCMRGLGHSGMHVYSGLSSAPASPPKPRAALRRVGAKAQRERNDIDEARDVVRARVLCAAWKHGDYVCGKAYPHDGEHVHHVWPEDRDRGVHDPQRMLFLCHTAHRWAHENPAKAAELGLLRPTAR